VVALAVLVAIAMAFVLGLAFGGSDGIDPADCRKPPGPWIVCAAP
jgi:hypothetical protein